MLRVRSVLRKLAARPQQGSEPASLEEIWAEAWETLPSPWSPPSPESYLPTIERMLRSTDDEIIAFLHESLQPIGRHSASRFLAFLDNSYGATDRWTAWVVALSPDIARWLGSDFGHDRAQRVLERVPAEQLYPLAQAFVAETLGEPDPEYHDVGTYWPSIIAGVVRDTASHPIAQAHVSIDNGAGTALEVSTGSDGSYATGTLSPGTYTVSVSAYGFVPAEATVVVLEGVPATATDFTLEVRLPFTIAGAITDSHRTPIVGAQVLLMQQNWDKRLDNATDSAGGYTLSMDPMDYTGRYWLRVTASGYAEGFRDLAIPNGASLREDFVLPELGAVTGTVVVGGTSPTPVAGAEVKATFSTDDPLTQPSVTAVSDSTGRYLLRLPPGSTAITVRARGFENYATTVAVMSGSTLDRDIPLTEASASLSCTVSDVYSTASINHAYVQAGGEFARGIGKDDRYHVSNIPAGAQEVDIHADGYKPQKLSFDFTAGQTIAMDFYLEPLVTPPHPPDPPHIR